MPNVRLVVTDLDNTLWDWVGFFAASFRAMLVSISEITGASVEQLQREFRAVHRAAGDIERPFAALDLPEVHRFFGTSDRRLLHEHLAPALEAFDAERRRSLVLYPTVAATLERLAESNVRVVGHTESAAINAEWRLRTLGIAQRFHRLYALASNAPAHPRHGTSRPPQVPPGWLVSVPRTERKPNPVLLRHICESEGIPIGRTLYVGDSLTRDIMMAREAGVRSAWARYGTAHPAGAWETLVAVTHWTDEDVAREQELRLAASGIAPDVTLDRFGDLLAKVGIYGNANNEDKAVQQVQRVRVR